MVDLWQIIIPIEVLCIFSYFYRDNPFYKIAEHVFIGTATGIALSVAIQSTILTGVKPLLAGKISLLPPIVLGILVFTRITKKWIWISQYSFALLIGVGTGVSSRGVVSATIIRLIGTVIPAWGTDMWSNVEALIYFIMAATILIYFLFSFEHSGAVGYMATIGQYSMMVFFGQRYSGYIYSFTSNALYGIGLIFTPPGIYITIIGIIIVTADALLQYSRNKSTIPEAGDSAG